MSTNDSELQAQARKILDAIAFIPFEQCQPLSRKQSEDSGSSWHICNQAQNWRILDIDAVQSPAPLKSMQRRQKPQHPAINCKHSLASSTFG